MMEHLSLEEENINKDIRNHFTLNKKINYTVVTQIRKIN